MAYELQKPQTPILRGDGIPIAPLTVASQVIDDSDDKKQRLDKVVSNLKLGRDIKFFSCTFLKDNWVQEENNYYTQTVDCEGITQNTFLSSPSIKPTGDSTQDDALLENLALLRYGETLNGQIKYTCYEGKPTIDLTVYFQSLAAVEGDQSGGGGGTGTVNSVNGIEPDSEGNITLNWTKAENQKPEKTPNRAWILDKDQQYVYAISSLDSVKDKENEYGELQTLRTVLSENFFAYFTSIIRENEIYLNGEYSSLGIAFITQDIQPKSWFLNGSLIDCTIYKDGSSEIFDDIIPSNSLILFQLIGGYLVLFQILKRIISLDTNVSGILPVANGGTGVDNLVKDDYSENRPRGIIIQSEIPQSVPEGCIIGVYDP